MKIVLLGATGLTGQEALSQALKAGHEVTAVVRSPEKITIQNDNLKVEKGDIMDSKMLAGLFAGKEAVVSCLGFPRAAPVTGYTESMKSIVAAMRKEKISRLITMTSWWSDTSTASDAGFIVRWMVIPFIKSVLSNMRQMEIYLENECSDLDYTVVRPPGLGKKPLTGRGMAVQEDFMVKLKGASSSTNRSDVAAFMLSLLNDNQYAKKFIAITYMPEK